MRNVEDNRSRHQKPRSEPRQHYYRPRDSQPPRPISDREKLVLQYLHEMFDLNAELPTSSVICARFRLGRTQLEAILLALNRKGYITLFGRAVGTVELTGKPV